ncbi:MAG TPA: hypothetical protein VJ792_02515 [Candidatus Nitrosotalea sp.]|nr:hypothetical protein [Candidatus Nitrosotalea sp.]
MAEDKDKIRADDVETAVEDAEQFLDGKGLHDLYRHTTKLIK